MKGSPMKRNFGIGASPVKQQKGVTEEKPFDAKDKGVWGPTPSPKKETELEKKKRQELWKRLFEDKKRKGPEDLDFEDMEPGDLGIWGKGTSPSKMTEDVPGADSPLYQRFVREWKENKLAKKAHKLDKKVAKRKAKAKEEMGEAKDYQELYGDEFEGKKGKKGYTFETHKMRKEFEKEHKQGQKARKKYNKSIKKYNKNLKKLNKLQKKRIGKKDYPHQTVYGKVKTDDLD